MRYVLVMAMLVAATGVASAQSSIGNTYKAPTWGQYGETTWGTYSGAVEKNGWNYNSQLQPNEPVGSILADPNSVSSSFENSSTGAKLFQPQDTRLKGRDRP